MTMQKYHSRKVEYNGTLFDSKKELERYKVLAAMEERGEIDQLQRQVKFELIPKQPGERAVNYIADFVYICDGQMIVEDVKGYRTPEYIIKRKLMLQRYWIKIQEV